LVYNGITRHAYTKASKNLVKAAIPVRNALWIGAAVSALGIREKGSACTSRSQDRVARTRSKQVRPQSPAENPRNARERHVHRQPE